LASQLQFISGGSFPPFFQRKLIVKIQPANPTEVRRDNDRDTDEVETSPDARYNRTFAQPGAEDNEQPVATEDEIEHSKQPYKGEVK